MDYFESRHRRSSFKSGNKVIHRARLIAIAFFVVAVYVPLHATWTRPGVTNATALVISIVTAIVMAVVSSLLGEHVLRIMKKREKEKGK